MLTIRTNKNNCKLTYVPLNVSSINTGETVYDNITIVTNESHNLKENDEVALIRQDGDSISYFKNCEVKDVIDKTGFTIDGFGKYTIGVNGYKQTFIKYSSRISADNHSTVLYTKDGHEILVTGDTLNSDNILNTITAISIGCKVEHISDDAFSECEYLEKILVRLDNKKYTSENDILFNKNKTVLICYPRKKTGVNYMIPVTVEKINNNAFNGAVNLANVTIPSFIERIGNNAFSGCSNLTEITCKPIDPPIISDTTFDKSILENIYVKKEQTKRYKTAWKKLKSKIEGDESIVDDEKISQTNTILHINVDPYIIEITGSTLDSGISENYSSSLYSVEIGTDVNTIGERAFINCTQLTSVTIPNTVVSIGNYAFYHCDNTRFTTIVIPDSVTRIDDYAFSECTHLMYIYLGNNVTKIGRHAFFHIYGNSRYGANIYLRSNDVPSLGDSYVFAPNAQQQLLNFYVPTESINDYRGVYMSPNSLIDLSDASEKQYICLNTNEHIFTTNKDDVNTKRRYLWDADGEEFKYEGAITMCDGDYYTFDNLFLFKNINNSSLSNQNIILNITATTANYNPILLRNCLIGSDYDGKDDKYHIYIPYNENVTFVRELENRFPVTTFTADDIRFLYNGNNQMEFGCELQPGTNVDKVCGNIEIDFGIGDSFEVNLHHDEQIANYVEKVKDNSINKIIDYERYQYTPMYYAGSIPEYENGKAITPDEYLKRHSNEIDKKLKRVNEIKFHLYFRSKVFTLYDDDGNVIPITGNTEATDYVDFGTWQTDNNGYWNSYTLRSDHKALEMVYKNYNVYGDLLGYLGFTDDDVYYQKDALKKSFIRLSFYDSPNRETQKLLYYSTIYFDSNVLSAKYINDLNVWRETEGYSPMFNQLVFGYDIKRIGGKKASVLTAEMSCTDKYDNTSSSDGFYLHLFDKLVSGDTCTPIYMKAEFNNAKFGKTVPMIRPIFSSSNKRIPPTNSSFPREYMRAKMNEEGKIYNWTDMDMLLQDMYIKIYIKYNFNTHQFVWFVPQSEDDYINNTLTFDLFEPRINGYDFESYNALNGNDVGYGTSDGTPNWYEGWFNENYEWVTPNGETESEWAASYNGCCLMTTAITLPNENMLDGTKLFNKKAMANIAYVWIDGMMARNDNVYDEETGEYITTNFQLPDIPFKAYIRNGDIEESFTWTAVTTIEKWDDSAEYWYDDPEIKPKKIHRVNYYFKTNTKDQTKLIDELYLGINGHKKTKEITEDLCRQLKNSIPSTPSETLPNGMFNKVASLKCVKIVKNGSKRFVTIGNGAFNNCQSLIRVNIEENALDIIGKNCFSGCRSLKAAYLSNTKIILREAFQGCYTLTKVTFKTNGSNNIKYIGCGSFGYTKVRYIELPNSILRIGNSAFRRCYQLCSFAIEGTNQSLTVGKRIFAECAILKYNLVVDTYKSTKNMYDYRGGVPDIVRYLANNGNKIKFYDTCRNKYVTLAVSSDKDRGKMMHHYLDSKYHKYIHEKQTSVMNFRDWYRHMF